MVAVIFKAENRFLGGELHMPRSPLQLELDFGNRLNQVLSPSRAIESAEFLRGRSEQLTGIRRALYTPGRQVFIYGYRGVGKTSLAHTAAFEYQSADGRPMMVSCTADSTCYELVKQLGEASMPSSSKIIKQTIDRGVKLGASWASYEFKSKLETGVVPLPTSLADCARVLEFVSLAHSERPVAIIDEFDRIGSSEEQAKFGDLVKMIGDQGIGIRLLLCGIGTSIDQLLKSHLSTHRYFHTVSLPRLSFEPRLEIIDKAASDMSIEVDSTTRYRISTISDGFPHYVHLLCEKLFWEVFNAGKSRVSPNHFEAALAEAVKSMEPELKRPYDEATKKYSNDYEPVLWAAADGDELERASRDIFKSYERIRRDLGTLGNTEAADRAKFNNMMNRLKKPSHGEILVGTRSGWYAYREKVVRGYARLRALQNTIKLEREHPLQPRRIDVFEQSWTSSRQNLIYPPKED